MARSTADSAPLIGRRHSVEQTVESFKIARELGFDDINMDLIMGLPEESLEDVRDTLEQIMQLKPDNLTVHSLALKRAARLNMFKEDYKNGMFTMGDVALCSERNEDLLYKLFGKNAELLIDHAWGWEPTTIKAIKAYRPSSNSLSSGQVLHCPYESQKAKLVVREMTDLLVLDLVDKGLVTDQMVLTVGYDIENLTNPARRAKYHGAVEKDPYGREIPKQAHGSINLDGHTSSTRKIMCAVSELFDRIVDKNLLVRRMYVVANHVLPEADAPKKNDGAVQLDLFTDYAAEEEKQKAVNAALERERKIQAATLAIKKKYGKNAILKAMNLEEGATAKDRNAQIGGHKA